MAVTSGAMLTIVIPGVMNPAAGSHTWMVDSSLGNAAPVSVTVMIGEDDGGTMPEPTMDMVDVSDAMVTARPEEPGAATQITVRFTTGEDLEVDQSITFEVDDSLGVPSSIDEADVSITGMTSDGVKTASPRSVIVEVNRPAERYRITLFIGNMDDSADAQLDLGLDAGDVTVTFRQGAGITNRTEGGDDDWFVYTTEEPRFGRQNRECLRRALGHRAQRLQGIPGR